MLHPLNVVTCETEMMRLVKFQRGLLELAIRLGGKKPRTEATFIAVLGNDAGKWFWKKYSDTTTKDGKKFDSTWKKLLLKLVKVCSKHNQHLVVKPDLSILDAFDHDIEFYKQLTNSNWKFLYPELHKDLRVAIQPLLEYGYEYLGTTGYDVASHGTADYTLSREQFLEHYVNANKEIKVCPVCDWPLEIKIAKSGTEIPWVEVDHFFPKSLYPFLSLHPYNLVPACNNCNARIKLKTNPLANSDAKDKNYIPDDALVNTYHAYQGRSILKLDCISTYRSSKQKNNLQVNIIDKSGSSGRRIKTATRVYNLSKRWTINIRDHVVEPLVELLMHEAEKNPSRSPDDFKNDLEFAQKKCCEGKRHYDTLKKAYLDYALSDPEEWKYLMKAYQDKLASP